MKPAPKQVKAWFDYDPETGQLIRKRVQRANIPRILNPSRHRVDFLGVRYQVTHIIWVIYYGKWPTEFIDHIDHNRMNRRIVNLREATRSENCWNRLSNNDYGKGVTYRYGRTSKPWQAQIQHNNQKVHLGFFDEASEAAQAYSEAAARYHGEFACVDDAR